MSSKKTQIAFCGDCEVFFRARPDERFLRESFCPKCSGRARKQFATLQEARRRCGRLPLASD